MSPPLLRLAGAIDAASRGAGRAASWLALAMVLVGAGNALLRRLGRGVGHNLASNAWIELQWYLFSLVFLLGASYALERGAHVRVDVLYGRLGGRARAWIDLLGTLLFLLPFAAASVALAWPAAAASFAVREVSPDPGGLARWPLRAAIPAAFALLFLQGIAEAIRSAARLRTGGPDRNRDAASGAGAAGL